MTPEEIREVIGQYTKHGWQLRRALLTPSTVSAIVGATEGSAVFGDIRPAEHDALWFSRRSKENCETWELRRLSGPPFALVEVIANELGNDARESILSDIYERMFEMDSRPLFGS